MFFGVVVDRRLFGKLLEHAYERRQNGFVRAAHEMRECSPEVPGRLLEVVVWNAGEHVVHLVGADAVDDVVNCSVVAVDGGELAAHEVPAFVGVPRRVHLVMMQERDNHDVGTEHEQRHAVVDDERRQAVRGAVLVCSQSGDRHCRKREHTTDHVTHEHLLEWIEMVNMPRIVAARRLTQAVRWFQYNTVKTFVVRAIRVITWALLHCVSKRAPL